eukprot:4498465-Prymnesium_polylepis.1
MSRIMRSSADFFVDVNAFGASALASSLPSRQALVLWRWLLVRIPGLAEIEAPSALSGAWAVSHRLALMRRLGQDRVVHFFRRGSGTRCGTRSLSTRLSAEM